MEIDYVISWEVVSRTVSEHALVACATKACSELLYWFFFKKTKPALYFAAKGSEISMRQLFMGRHMG